MGSAMAVMALAILFAQSMVPVAHTHPRFVVWDDYIRDKLAHDWDAHETDGIALERAYCVRWQMDIFAGEWAYRITQIEAPDTVRFATPSSVSFTCRPGVNVATVHVHPFSTCLSGTDCVRGGPYGGQCFPSDQDREFIKWRGDPFGVVQCARDGLVPYWPAGE
ncbi:MAG: hypothetical protein ACTHNC_13930 [Humibacter sp.]